MTCAGPVATVSHAELARRGNQDAAAADHPVDDVRVNTGNYRKEFFRVPMQRLREFVMERKLDATFTMIAEAREYRETLAYEKRTPEEQQKYHQSEDDSGASAE